MYRGPDGASDIGLKPREMTDVPGERLAKMEESNRAMREEVRMLRDEMRDDMRGVRTDVARIAESLSKLAVHAYELKTVRSAVERNEVHIQGLEREFSERQEVVSKRLADVEGKQKRLDGMMTSLKWSLAFIVTVVTAIVNVVFHFIT